MSESTTPSFVESRSELAPLNTLAIVSFILSFVVTVAGIVLGFIALAQVKRTGARGRGFAIAAVVLGLVLSAVWIVVGLAIISLVALVGQHTIANDAATESDLASVKLAELEYATHGDGQFTTSVVALKDYGFTPSEATSRLSIDLDSSGSDFCAQAISTGNHFFHVTESVGVESGPCLG